LIEHVDHVSIRVRMEQWGTDSEDLFDTVSEDAFEGESGRRRDRQRKELDQYEC
jgi:hypothetical protein